MSNILSVKLKIKEGVEVELTLDELKQLQSELGTLFEKQTQFVPYYFPYSQPYRFGDNKTVGNDFIITAGTTSDDTGIVLTESKSPPAGGKTWSVPMVQTNL